MTLITLLEILKIIYSNKIYVMTLGLVYVLIYCTLFVLKLYFQYDYRIHKNTSAITENC